MPTLKRILFAVYYFCTAFALPAISCQAQSPGRKDYADSIRAFRDNYINTHEVVKTAEDRSAAYTGSSVLVSAIPWSICPFINRRH